MRFLTLRLPQNWGPRGALLLLLVLALPAQAAKKAETPSIPAAQAQAFQLGFALQTPAAQAQLFLQAVKGLKNITDDVQGTSEVGRLADRSDRLREVSARAYGQSAQMLRTMGAPAKMQAWAQSAADQLDAPLVLSKEARKYTQSDPHTATVMGTIDEAQSLKVAADAQMPDLLSWLKLSHGADAVWASAVGSLAAGMHAAVVNNKSLLISQTDPLKLADTAPPNTPPAVLKALTDLTPKRGNLAGLIRLPPAPVTPKNLNDSQKTLLDAFGAKPLAEVIDK